MSTQQVPIGFVNEAGDPVLLPEPKAWLGTKDRAYAAALERARTYYASDLLYSAGSFNAMQAQRDELLAALTELMAAEEEQQKARGGPWVQRPIPNDVQMRVRLAWQRAHTAVAKASGSAS